MDFVLSTAGGFGLALTLATIVWYNSLRNRATLTRSALLPPRRAPWSYVWKHADDGSFLNLTGFSREAFRQLVDDLFPRGRPALKRKRGRPELLSKEAMTGLYLYYVNSKMEEKHLCLIFGVTPSTLSRMIDKMRALIISRLIKNPKSRILWPNENTMEHFAFLVRLREPSVHDVIGFVDGLSIPVQCDDDELTQNAHYDGYHHDTTVNNVFAFSPLGKIFYASINFPGSFHDTSVSSSLIDIVIRRIGIYKLCVDQGFPRAGDLFDKFVGPLSKKSKRLLAPALKDLILDKHEKYVSLRQASEWGMRALQGTFARLKSRLTSNIQKRHDIILSIVLLHNYRTDVVGLNQIATVFNPEYEQYINLDGYDRIARYYSRED